MKWKFADEISVVVVAVKNNMCDVLTNCIKILIKVLSYLWQINL